ncbi:MAG: RidA family protein [Planctomycetota bacterium]
MGRTIICTDKAPQPVGPYSQAVKLDSDLVFTSGQLGIDPVTGMMAAGIEAQTRQVMLNLEAVLHAAGGSLDNVLKTTVFLADMRDFGAMNGVFAGFFKTDPPARSCIQAAALPKGGLVEIECIARV